MQISIQELTFWLGILKDHSTFIFNSLGPNEKESANQAKYLESVFQDLLSKVQLINEIEVIEAVEQLINLKKNLLMKSLNCNVVIHLEPTDLNQMINEAQEFLRLLQGAPGFSSVPSVLHLHRLWIYDALAHSSILYRALSPNEHDLLQQIQHYERQFNLLFIKAISKSQMFDKLGNEFPSLYYTSQNIQKLFKPHIELLNQIEKLLQQCNIESTTKALSPNHMIREERYFLNKITEILNKN